MQKEKLSALMDGELLDHELCGALSKDRTLQKSWYRYHLIRDSFRGDVTQVMDFALADRIALAIESEPAVQLSMRELQPAPETWQKMSFWHKVKPWFSQLGQIGVAACVSLAVIIGYQSYSQPEEQTNTAELAAFNTFSIGGLASPVSYGVAGANNTSNDNSQEQEQRKRIAILQDYELQRRLYAEPLNITSPSIPADSAQLGNH